MKKFATLMAAVGMVLLTSGAAMAWDLPAPDSAPNSCTQVDGKYPPAVEIPCKALDDFNAAWNRSDDSLADTLNYPHVRMTSGNVRTWNTAEEYRKDNKSQGAAMAAAMDWKYSKWAYRYVVQSGMDGNTGHKKYHVVVAFVRYNSKDQPIPGQTHKSLYIITNVDGHWGTQFRSSLAGETVPGKPF